MAGRRKEAEVISVNGVTPPKRKAKPAANPDSREKQMINLAVDLAEKQLREGTASSQVIVHYLKLGTEKAKLERTMLESQMKLLEAKTESIEASKHGAEIAEAAIEAMKRYNGGS